MNNNDPRLVLPAAEQIDKARAEFIRQMRLTVSAALLGPLLASQFEISHHEAAINASKYGEPEEGENHPFEVNVGDPVNLSILAADHLLAKLGFLDMPAESNGNA